MTKKNIIAHFCSPDKKQEFLSKARKAKLHTNDLGFPGPHHYPLYVNDHLTVENKRLFAKALSLKREKGWAFFGRIIAILRRGNQTKVGCIGFALKLTFLSFDRSGHLSI